jgi:hypothetical protein
MKPNCLGENLLCNAYWILVVSNPSSGFASIDRRLMGLYELMFGESDDVCDLRSMIMRACFHGVGKCCSVRHLLYIVVKSECVTSNVFLSMGVLIMSGPGAFLLGSVCIMCVTSSCENGGSSG